MAAHETLRERTKATAADTTTFEVGLEHLQDFEFRVAFDWDHLPGILVDEPEPLGKRRGPNASRLLAAAVGNCLAASLLFCLRKSRIEPQSITARVRGQLARNDRDRWRIAKLDVLLELEADTPEARLERCLSVFEDYCIVTQSVRGGIPVRVRVVDTDGHVLHDSADTGRLGS